MENVIRRNNNITEIHYAPMDRKLIFREFDFTKIIQKRKQLVYLDRKLPPFINFPLSYRRGPYEPSEETPALINQVNIEEIPDENLPTAPPSYEDVIKDNPGILAGGVPTAPPSYTESCSATTTQV